MGDPESAIIEINSLDIGWLLAAVWAPARDGDVVARSLFRRLKVAAVSLGVEWRYGEPWDPGK